MYKFAAVLLSLIFVPAVFAEKKQDTAIFTDQDLMRYKRSSEPEPPPQDLDHIRSKAIKKDSRDEPDAQGSAVTKAKDEISESEKKSIEREFNRIVTSMKSLLEAGNIEEALLFFVESRKDKHRKMFTTLKDINKLRAAFEGYEGVEIGWVYEHLSESHFIRKEHGELYSYPINFMETAKGVWKIYDF
ncbi:MAG: hypothetical protein ACYC69_16175 [Thermodesulfovibrionales bacterium]